MLHDSPSKYAGETVKIFMRTPEIPEGAIMDFHVKDWWDRYYGKSWMGADSNPAALVYAIRTSKEPEIPHDDEVLYGKIMGLGTLVHVSEIAEVYR